MSKRKGFSYYIRLDNRTFQGQLIRLYTLVAIVTLAILLFFRYTFVNYHSQKEYVHNTLLPTASRTQILTDIFEISENPANQLERAKIHKLLTELNQLSDSWKEESTTLYYQHVLDAIEGVQQLAVHDPNWKRNEKYQALQKNLSRLQSSVLSAQKAIEEGEGATTKYLDLYLLLGFLIFFLFGITISHISIKTILVKIKTLRGLMANISKGYIPETIDQTPDEFSSTRQEISSLAEKLKALTHFAKEVGHGNFDAAIDVFEADSTLGRSLSEMRDSLKKVTQEEISRSWFNEGIAKFSEVLRKNNQDIKSLTNEIIAPLVKYMGAIQGAVFLVENDSNTNTSYLKMSSCYAYDRLKYIDRKIHAGSGLIGQAFLEKEKIHLTEIPDDYESVTTGLGTGRPKSIIIIPLLENGRIEGVLEIASMKKFEEHQINFLEKISETIAVTVSSVKNSEKTQQLLEEAQMATEQLRAQEEEMRQNMEELQATQEDMARTQQEMATKESSQQAFIDHTPDAVVSISADYKVVFFNNAFKTLSHNSLAKSVKEGDHILPILGAAVNDWKSYFARTFEGECLAFTSAELKDPEGARKEYLLYPIPSKTGRIEHISILIRDYSKMQHSLNSFLNRDN